MKSSIRLAIRSVLMSLVLVAPIGCYKRSPGADSLDSGSDTYGGADSGADAQGAASTDSSVMVTFGAEISKVSPSSVMAPHLGQKSNISVNQSPKASLESRLTHSSSER